MREATLVSARPLALLRADDPSDAEVRHPLLRSWGRPYRERTVLLASAESRGIPAPLSLDADEDTAGGVPGTLLARVQHDLRAGCAPAGDFELDTDDRSIQVHSCHGQVRQVQVLRDAILHLLADDPTLSEEDIVVLSPAIDQFAPLVEAGFGTSAEGAAEVPGSATPRLFYRVTDRSLRESYPVLAALDSLLALVSGRFTASEVLEFVSLPAVRKRFDLDDDALGTIADWVVGTNVRWGLDGRAPRGVGPPAGVHRQLVAGRDRPGAHGSGGERRRHRPRTGRYRAARRRGRRHLRRRSPGRPRRTSGVDRRRHEASPHRGGVV